MKRVIFVDDEPQVLRGLEKSMGLIADDWEMAFVNSGEKLLEKMAEDPFDAVVTDLRMPGMNGGAVIEALHKSYPDVARIVLSGQSSREATFRTVHPMHLYLSKPCDNEALYSAVQRALALQELLNDTHLKKLATRLKHLPSKPELYDRVVTEMASPDAGVRTIGEIVAQDVGMSAKILQMANSARFGLRREVFDAVQATVVLGMETIRDFVLAVGVARQYSNINIRGFCLNDFSDRSLTIAKFAKSIAVKQGADKATCDEAFTSGLLHDIGQLVLIELSPEAYQHLLAGSDDKTPLCDAELEAFGAAHPSIGAYALGQWGLPQTVVEAVGFHHQPNRIRHKKMLPVMAVHVAAAFERRQSANPKEWETNIDLEYLLATGHRKEHLSAWENVCSAKQRA